jgi:hypothetical protein
MLALHYHKVMCDVSSSLHQYASDDSERLESGVHAQIAHEEVVKEMHWIAPSEKDTDSAAIKKRCVDAVDQFRANSRLEIQEYLSLLRSLIFLRFDDLCFVAQHTAMAKAGASSCRSTYADNSAAYQPIAYCPKPTACGPVRC